MILSGSVANAQTVSRAELESQYKALLVQVIELLMKKIATLQAQLAALQSVQAPIVNQLTTPVAPIVNQPVATASSTPQVEATSTPVIIPVPQKQYNPTIKLEIVGSRVVWQASGEPFQCKLNGESVPFEGSRETNGVTTHKLTCVGGETGTKLEKTIQ